MNAQESEVPDLAALDDDGDTIELEDGRTLRLRIEPDEFDGAWSDDAYGRIGFDGPGNDFATRTRPKGFDGNAERLYYGNNGPWWWQPPADGPKRGTEEFRRFREHVRELLAFGFSSVGLEVLEGTDHYGRPIVTGAAWLGGIDTLDSWEYVDPDGTAHPFERNGYLREIVSELWAEVQHSAQSSD